MQIHTRAQRNGPELDLIKAFLPFIESFCDEKFEYEILHEPYAEAGIPDIVVIAWDSELVDNWVSSRSDLNKEDIKLTHHISTFKNRGVNKSRLSQQLGYSNILVDRSLEKLKCAEIICETNNRVFVEDINTKFFIKQIITFEAKIKNWKTALSQAQLNENFSSHSYVLLPDKIAKEGVCSAFQGNTGLVTHTGKKIIRKKRARKMNLPGSYFSWLLNEWVGRNFSGKINNYA